VHRILYKRGTLAGLDAAAAAGALVAGEIYFIEDEGTLAVGVSQSAYQRLQKL